MKFDEWFEQNKDELEKMLRGDAEEALFIAWLAGYAIGMEEAGEWIKPLFSPT